MNAAKAMIPALAIVLSACSVTPERHREARLMPPDVAKRIVAQKFGLEWANRPWFVVQKNLYTAMFCSDVGKAIPVAYTDMKIGFNHLTIRTEAFFVIKFNKVFSGSGCGIDHIQVRMASMEDAEDLIDALQSLGATIPTSTE